MLEHKYKFLEFIFITYFFLFRLFNARLEARKHFHLLK